MHMRFVLTLAASVALAACGGGSGDDYGHDYDHDRGPSQGTQSTLTRANYVPVAQTALTTNAYLLDVPSMFLGAEVSDSAVLVKFIQSRVAQFPRPAAAVAQAVAVGVVTVEEELCGQSGKVQMEYNDANNNGFDDRGDSVVIKAYNCAFGGAVLNGQVKLMLNSTSGNPDTYPYSMSATAVATDLSATAAGVTTKGSGSMDFRVSEQSAVSQDINLYASSFSITTVSGTTTTSQTLKGYEVSLNVRPYSPQQQLYTSSVNGTLIDSAFAYQAFNIKTTRPFTRLSNQRYADQGEITITDSFRGTVRAKVLSTTTVGIDLDEDGNGSYETGVNKLWSEML